MRMLAAGPDIPSWGGLLISALVAGGALLVFVIKAVTRGGEGDDKLVARLDKRIDDLQDDLDEERRGRSEDNRKNTELVERIRSDHSREMQKLREEMADLHTAYEVMKAMAAGRWPNNQTNGGI